MTLTLFHYPMSPFSEKVRAMLGHAGLAWQSVRVPELPPRPVLETLAGGYRRIPVAQIGADVFCDTRTIATEIARLARRPRLALEQGSPQAQQLARRCDLEIFLACMACANTLALGRKMLAGMALLDIPRFLWDRATIGLHASMGRALLSSPRDLLRRHLAELEQRLQAQHFLFGAQPQHADFSAYHGLWFLRELAESPLLDGFSAVNAWMDRLQALRTAPAAELSAEAALAQTAAAKPRRVPAALRQTAQLGAWVAIAPSDYAQAATLGTLVGESDTRWILAREVPGLGTLHVHFPREGYRLTKGEPASSEG